MSADERHTNCEIFFGRLSRYADGDLSPRESEESRLHVDVCPRCQAAFESHKKLILMLESSKELEPPWDLDFKVLEAVGFGGARTQLRGYRVSPPLVWAATVVGLIGLGLGGWVLGQGIARLASVIFGPSGVLSTEVMAGLASKLTRHLVTIWDGLLAGTGMFEPLGRSLGAVSDAAKGNPIVIGTLLGTLALVLIFFRLMTKERSSHARHQHNKRLRETPGR
jgi:hypothetical protein